MKNCRQLFCFIIAVATACCAFGTDDADEIVRLFYGRPELEAHIRSRYYEFFVEHVRKDQLTEVIENYLQNEFPWLEFHNVCVAAFRSTFTPEEQAELLTFLKSPAGVKFRKLEDNVQWKSVGELLAQENEKLFSMIENALGLKKE